MNHTAYTSENSEFVFTAFVKDMNRHTIIKLTFDSDAEAHAYMGNLLLSPGETAGVRVDREGELGRRPPDRKD